MIQPIKDKRRRAMKKRFTPKPEWVEAFLIMLLRKGCSCFTCPNREPPLSEDASLTVKLSALKKFEQLKSNNRTKLTLNVDNQTVTLTAPEIKLPEKNIVIAPANILDKLN